jgi:multicomponent Na+:H+ antiporter subunit B
MNRTFRLLVFLAAVAVLLPAMAHGIAHMPAFGAHPLVYGDAINHDAPAQRHVSNMVSAVNFDYRGFDTLGEEFMLLCAVTGAVVLLRGNRGETPSARPGEVPGRPADSVSDAVVLIVRLLGPLSLLFGLYVVLHATATPGGGFQGGVIIASAGLLLWLGEGYRRWRRMMRARLLDAMEGGGALLFALCGIAPLLTGHAFLENILPYGQFRDMLSGGLMQVENAGVALSVAAGFTMLFVEFLEETREPEHQ